MNITSAVNRRPLTFSSTAIWAILVENEAEWQINGRSIVINLGHEDIIIMDGKPQSVQSLRSTILTDTKIQNIQKMIEISVRDNITIDGVVDDLGWMRYADLVTTPSHDLLKTPLFRSSQDSVGLFHCNETLLGVTSKMKRATTSFEVKVNFWFAPAGTDCLIHRDHSFVETHLQIYGIGRMQKFYSDSPDSLYEEIIMAPGFTQPFFNCARDESGTFIYPWHQYYAETDCAWMAIEFHLPEAMAPPQASSPLRNVLSLKPER